MEQNIILFIQKTFVDTVQAIKMYGDMQGKPYRVAVLYDETKKHLYKKIEGVDIELWCNFEKPESIAAALKPYYREFVVVTCRWESYIHKFAEVIPFVPYVRTPTAQSLLWSVDKIMMRKRFSSYDKSITPKYMVIKELSDEVFEKVRDKIGFPVIIKPAGLAQSILVSINYHEEEFKKNIKRVFREINKVYKSHHRTVAPQVLVEQFMDGQMYSVDAYVTSRGSVTCCPPVHVKTGRSVGFDDFFGYLQITPTRLSTASVEEAEAVVKKAVHALGLRSTTVHAELMRTDDGWKIIEIGPRIGGYRVKMYRHSFGFDHGLNDVLVRLPTKVKVNKKVKGYTAAMKLFAKKEGTITAIKGIRKIMKLESILECNQKLKIGQKAKFAKHGGTCVLEIILFNKDRSSLFADIRRVEQMIDIQTKK